MVFNFPLFEPEHFETPLHDVQAALNLMLCAATAGDDRLREAYDAVAFVVYRHAEARRLRQQSPPPPPARKPIPPDFAVIDGGAQ